MKLHMTKTSLRAIDTDKPTGIDVYDDDLAAFGARVYPTVHARSCPTRAGGECECKPKKSIKYFVRYSHGRRRRMIFGTIDQFAPEEARKRAKRLLGAASGGADPAAKKEETREAVTWRAWSDTYLEGVRKRKKWPQADERYHRIATKKFGKKLLEEVTRDDIDSLMHSMANRVKRDGDPRAGYAQANRFLASIRASLAAAMADGKVTANVATGIKAFREPDPRTRVLSNEELIRLRKAIKKEGDQHTRALFALLIDTGCRPSEALRAKWDDLVLDGDPPLWRIPTSKSGKPQIIPLSVRTTALLKSLKRVGSYVIASDTPDVPRTAWQLRATWVRIRKAAKLTGVRAYDIRRTYGLRVAREAGLLAAYRLLRHSDPKVTAQHYVPLGVEELVKVVESVNRAGEVVQLQKAMRRR